MKNAPQTVAEHVLPFELEYHPPTSSHPGWCRACTLNSPRWGTPSREYRQQAKFPSYLVPDRAEAIRRLQEEGIPRQLAKHLTFGGPRFTRIMPHTKPDLDDLITFIVMRKFNNFKYYGLRALPPGQATDVGEEAFPSHVYADGIPTLEYERGAGAIMIPAIAECEDFAAWQRGFNRGFNLLRQYALMHCDDSPLRMYKLLVLGSNEAEPLNEDFEISMIGAKALAVYRLACVAPPTGFKWQAQFDATPIDHDKPRRATTPPEPPRMFLPPGAALEVFEQVRHAIGEHMPEEFSHPAALMAGEIGDPNKLW